MTTKNYLSQALKAQGRIAVIKEQIERLRSDMESLSASVIDGSKVQSTPSRDPMGDRLARIIDKIKGREADLAWWEDLLFEVESALNGIDCVTCYKVLHARYIRGAALKEIAAELGYSYSWVKQLHSTGLKEIMISAYCCSDLKQAKTS